MAIRRNPHLEKALEAKFSEQPEGVITAAKFIADTLREQRKFIREESSEPGKFVRNYEEYLKGQGRIALEGARAEGAAFVLDCVAPLPNEQPWMEAIQEVSPTSLINKDE